MRQASLHFQLNMCPAVSSPGLGHGSSSQVQPGLQTLQHTTGATVQSATSSTRCLLAPLPHLPCGSRAPWSRLWPTQSPSPSRSLPAPPPRSPCSPTSQAHVEPIEESKHLPSELWFRQVFTFDLELFSAIISLGLVLEQRTMEYVMENTNDTVTNVFCLVAFLFTDLVSHHIHRPTMFAVGNICRVQLHSK